MGQEDGRRRDRDLDDRQKDRHRDSDKGKGKRTENDHERDASREKGRNRGDETRTGQNDGAVMSSRELEDRIRRSREERLKKEGRGSASKLLSEQDDGDDLLGWVQKTKQLEEKRKRDEEKAQAAATARRLAEAEAEDEDSDEDQYDARHLAGLKVTHGLEKVMDGGAIVLTLKDTSILDEKGNEVNDETDELENVEIIEQKRRDDARKAAKKGPNVYDKFDNDGEGGRGILPQYDDSKEQEEGVVLDEEGGLDLKSRQRMEEIQRKLTGAAAAEGGKESLLGGGQRVASEYFTQEEMERFKKPKEKKKKKLRKREKLDLDAMEEEAKAAGLGAADRGSRAARKPEDIEKERRKGEASEREAAYEHALDKAEAASRALKDAAMGGQLEEGDEEDDELVQSLERARQAALKAAPKGVEAVASKATELAKKEPTVRPEPDTDAGLVFTSTGEFVRGISLEEVVKKEKNELFDDDDDNDEDMKDADKVEEEATGGWTEVTEQEGGGRRNRKKKLSP